MSDSYTERPTYLISEVQVDTEEWAATLQGMQSTMVANVYQSENMGPYYKVSTQVFAEIMKAAGWARVNPASKS